MDLQPPASPAARARQARAAACLHLLLLCALSWQVLRGCQTPPTEAGRAGNMPAPIVVDLMRDPAWRIALLPGIGPARAWNIVRDRRREPPYLHLEDLQRIRGIGPGTIRRLRDTRTVRIWLDGQPVRCRPGSQPPPAGHRRAPPHQRAPHHRAPHQRAPRQDDIPHDDTR